MKVKNFTDVKLLLLNNKSVKQTIFKNTFWLVIAEAISQLLKLVLLIYVARILGATEYGKFTFALAFVSLFVIFSDFGLSSITTREFAREKEKEKEFSSIFTLKILLSLGALTLMLVGSFFITSDSAIRGVIWLLAVYALITNFFEIIYAFLRARQKMEYEAFAKILEAIILTSTGFFIILNFPSVQNLSYSYLFAGFISLTLILFFFHFKFFPLKISFKKSIWKRFLAMSWPLGFVAVFSVIYNHIDSVMMGYWGQITETGWYNAAYKIAYVILIPGTLIFRSFYPALSIAFRESKGGLQKIWNYQTGVVVLITIPLVVGGGVLAPRIIDFIYGSSFSPSTFAFQILIMMAGTMVLVTTFTQLLIIANQQKKYFWISFFGAITNIVLNLILIPKYSLYGAAIATFITMLLMLVLCLVAVVKFTSVRPLHFEIFLVFFVAFFCSIIMYFAISLPLIYNLNVLLAILIGAAVYLTSFLVVNKFLKLNLYV